MIAGFLNPPVWEESSAGGRMQTSCPQAESTGSPEEKALRDNALQVLVALGYGQKESAKAVKAVAYAEGMTEDDMVRLSLRELG